jgi:uncharacterized protein YbjT (DUF2867 family)
MINTSKRVLVTGGGTFLGDYIAAALLAEGAKVTLLGRAENEGRLGPLRGRVQWYAVDVWNAASLRGRARGHASVIHTVGSLIEDKVLGLNHHYLNFISARNVANMCVSDGVSQMVLISTAGAPWLSRDYVRSKRESEAYIGRVGLNAAIIRAPISFARGQARQPFFRLLTTLSVVPPFSWLGLGHIAPMPIEILARGVARITLQPKRAKLIYYGPDLRRLNTPQERRNRSLLGHTTDDEGAGAQRTIRLPEDDENDDAPFGWSPDKPRQG